MQRPFTCIVTALFLLTCVPGASASSSAVFLSLNGLDALTKKVLPILAEDNGLDDIDYDESLQSGTLQAYDFTANWFKGAWKDCIEYDIDLESNISLPIDANDVTASFTSSEGVLTDWDIDSAYVDGDVVVKLSKGDNSANVFCSGWKLLTGGFLGTNRIAFDLDEFTGEFDFTLKTASVAVNQITDISLKFADVTIGNSAVLTELVNVGLAVADVFSNDVSCNDLSECISEMLTDEVQTGSTKSQIKTALNDMLAKTAKIAGGESGGEYELTYDIATEAVDGKSSNRLETEWSADIDSDIEDDCAEDLRRGTFADAEAQDLGADIDLTVPYGLIGEAVFTIGKQGLLCAAFNGTLGEADAEDAVEDAVEDADYDLDDLAEYAAVSAPSYSGSIIPDGAIAIAMSEEPHWQVATKPGALTTSATRFTATRFSTTRQPTIRQPVAARKVEAKAVTLIDTEEDAIIITLPVKIGELSMTITSYDHDGEKTKETADADTLDVTGTLEITATIGLDCDDGLYLDIVAVAVEDLAGSAAWQGESISAAEFQDMIDEAVEDLADDLERVILLPKVTELAELGLFAELDETQIDDDAVHLGLIITDDAVCTEDDDDNDNGGGGGGYDPGPRTPGGFIPIDFPDPFDDDDDDGYDDVDKGGVDPAETMSL